MFEQLFKYTSQRPFGDALPAPDWPEGKPGKTAALLAELDCAPASTANLASATGLTLRQVWGLLKYHRDRGRVDFCPKTGIWQSRNADQAQAIFTE
jgi:hypothetical protein